ncbi:chloride channel protein [Actinobacillus pleuropneumoniae]|nr:chloride channel protein [Actinobacillus pleuropneumoniae]
MAFFSLGFAKLAEFGLHLNAQWTAKYPLAVWFVMPLGMAALAWFTAKYTPYVAEAVFPQVIASMSLPHGALKSKLVAFWQRFGKFRLLFSHGMRGFRRTGRSFRTSRCGGNVGLGQFLS